MNQLVAADAEYLLEGDDQILPEKFHEWAQLIIAVVVALSGLFSQQAPYMQSVHWVVARLTEYLPFELDQKQRILEIDHFLVRLENLQDALKDIEYYYSHENLNH